MTWVVRIALLAAFLAAPPAVPAQEAKGGFVGSEEAGDKAAFKSLLAEKVGIYPKLQKGEKADWIFKAQGFSVESLRGQSVAYYVASIKRPDGPMTAKELATYYPMDIAPYVESGLREMGMNLYRSSEAKTDGTFAGASPSDIEAGKRMKAQMEKNPQMAAGVKLRAQQDPNFGAQMRRMGITFDDGAPKPEDATRPFAASPLDQKGYAVVLLLSDLRDVAAERQKGGFLSQIGKSFTALKVTSELLVLKDGEALAAIRDTVLYQAGSPTRGSERLLAAIR